jgi:outer membrane protein OmpA-like peptidoglycan-associated protein/Tol biopolymer transport system component
MKMKQFLALLLVFCSLTAFSQISYSTKSKRAIKYFEMARRSYNSMNYNDALMYLDKAKKIDKKFVEAYLLAANIYEETYKFENEISEYKSVINIDPTYSPKVYFFLGETEYRMAHYDDAVKHLEQVFDFNNVSQRITEYTRSVLKKAKFAAYAVKHPVPFNPENLGPNINTIYDEYWPSLTIDGKTLFITRLVPKDPNYPYSQMNSQEDFYVSHKVNGKWTKAIPLGPPINTKQNEGAPTVTADGHSYYFTACNRRDGYGKCDLYFSKYLGGRWTKPINIGPPINTKAWESQPSVSADGRTLYFASSRPGTRGKMDIWVSHKLSETHWSKPVNLGDSINTDLSEMSPFIHPDGRTLYFASEGWPGMGGLDLFVSYRINDTTWTTPVNLGYPINTNGDEIGLIVDAKGDYALFSSSRSTKYGKDIFQFPLYNKIKPKVAVTYVSGKIIDAKTGKPVIAQIDLIDLEKDSLVASVSSDVKDGSYIAPLPLERNYAMSVESQGYMYHSENFSLKNIKNPNKPYRKDVKLQPIEIGNKSVLKNIFFETDSYVLKPESKAELNKLIRFLKMNPKVKIEISGHTDNRGSREHNMKLSMNRAKAVYDYLIAHGIDKNRLSYKGYGFDKPIATNDTPEGRALNRRTEFKIVGM